MLVLKFGGRECLISLRKKKKKKLEKLWVGVNVWFLQHLMRVRRT